MFALRSLSALCCCCCLCPQSAALRLASLKNKKASRESHVQKKGVRDSIDRQKTHGDGFQRLREMGSGSFGSVCEMMSSETGEIFAAKCIKISPANSEWEQIENDKKMRSAQAEIDAMTVSRHEHVVAVHGSYVDRRSCEVVMLMELVPGRSIADVIKDVGKFSEPVVRRYAKQMLLGLQHMHSLNCVHRDIKGQNILITTSATIKLADFGGARFQKPRSSEAEGNMKLKPDWTDFLYTPRWAAPELRHALFSPKSDIWAMASGKHNAAAVGVSIARVLARLLTLFFSLCVCCFLSLSLSPLSLSPFAFPSVVS